MNVRNTNNPIKKWVYIIKNKKKIEKKWVEDLNRLFSKYSDGRQTHEMLIITNY